MSTQLAKTLNGSDLARLVEVSAGQDVIRGNLVEVTHEMHRTVLTLLVGKVEVVFPVGRDIEVTVR